MAKYGSKQAADWASATQCSVVLVSNCAAHLVFSFLFQDINVVKGIQSTAIEYEYAHTHNGSPFYPWFCFLCFQLPEAQYNTLRERKTTFI